MAQPSIVFLMYHELQIPGRALCQSEPGYTRYAVPEAEFRRQMQYLKQHGYQGLSVGQALEFKHDSAVAITFDDGSETDLLTAAPILHEVGFNATFYVTVGWIDRPGHLSGKQLRELSNDFQIGCHSMTHAYLSDLDDTGLQNEITVAKSKLEQMIGKPVEHFSCPGGRYDGRVQQTARQAKYRSVATSRMHANSPATDVFTLGRIAVLRDLAIPAFSGICSGAALARMRAENSIREVAKHLLGSSIYDRLRARLLGGRN